MEAHLAVAHLVVDHPPGATPAGMQMMALAMSHNTALLAPTLLIAAHLVAAPRLLHPPLPLRPPDGGGTQEAPQVGLRPPGATPVGMQMMAFVMSHNTALLAPTLLIAASKGVLQTIRIRHDSFVASHIHTTQSYH